MLSQPKPIRIAFVGRVKVGRTYCAEYLRVHHKFVRMNLNDPVNRMLKIMYFYDRNKRVRWETKRALYDAIYKVDKDLLIGYLENRIKMSPSNIIVSDVRYTDEALKLKKMDFIIVRVTSAKNAKINPNKSLGPTASPGTLYLNEMYNRDFTKDIKVDYSIHNEEREATKKALDALVDLLTK